MRIETDMTMQDRLDARRAELDEAYRTGMTAAIAHLRRTAMPLSCKQVGDPAPDFTLADCQNRPVTLSDLLRAGPVVLSFFRGEWCPFCRIELDALIEARTAIAEAGAHLVMVSPQPPTALLLERTQAMPGLTVLHDPLNGVGLQYGLIFRMPDMLRRSLLDLGVDLTHLYGSDAWLLPIPATYVVRPNGTIALAHVDPDYTRRLDPEQLVQKVRMREEMR